jgi:hypothetical protein
MLAQVPTRQVLSDEIDDTRCSNRVLSDGTRKCTREAQEYHVRTSLPPKQAGCWIDSSRRLDTHVSIPPAVLALHLAAPLFSLTIFIISQASHFFSHTTQETHARTHMHQGRNNLAVQRDTPW